MGAFFTDGENKVRPGVYRKVTNREGSAIAGADDGKVAVLVNSNWGPMSAVSVVESVNEISEFYGSTGTVDTAKRIYEAGAKTLFIERVGTGGTKGTIEIKDDASASVATLEAKYEGDREFTITIRDSLGDAKAREFIVYEESTLMELLTFEKGTDEPTALVEVINEKSRFFNATKSSDGSGVIETAAQKKITVGTNPTVTNESYSAALELLEPFKFNVLAVDTDTKAVHLLVHAFVKRVYDNGTLCMAVVGEPISVEFDTRCSNAASYNDEKMVYVGGAYKDYAGNIVDGYKAAAVVAGLIASTPSNESVVHKIISGASEPAERLTNMQYEKAIKNGMILFSDTGDGGVWLDSAINTLINPAQNQDEGWKKVKRAKVRFELFDRLNRTLSPVIGKINCDSDGVANVEQLGGGVLAAMAAEGKILSGGTFKEDIENPHKADSAWFVINVDDIDTLEKIYLNYQLRFSSN